MGKFAKLCLASTLTFASSVFAQEPSNMDSDDPSPYFSESRSAARGVTLLQQELELQISKAKPSGVAYPKGIFHRASAWQKGAKVKVCFVNGTVDQWRLVKGIALEWNFPGSPVTLDFGNATTPASCGGATDISVAIYGTISSSPIGRASRSGTMVLGIDGLKAGSAKLRQIVLHEFGHALGLAHELKHADGECWNEFKPGALQTFYRSQYGIDDERVIREQIATYDPSSWQSLFSTSFNRHSVMMYSFPAELYLRGEASRCWAPINHQVSDGDKKTLQDAYLDPIFTASIVASLTSSASDDVKTMANAYNSLLLSSEMERKNLERAALSEGADASPLDIAVAILERSEAISKATYGSH